MDNDIWGYTDINQSCREIEALTVLVWLSLPMSFIWYHIAVYFKRYLDSI